MTSLRIQAIGFIFGGEVRAMNLLAAVQNHGYAATAVILLLSACGLPLPISIVLLTAGAAAHA